MSAYRPSSGTSSRHPQRRKAVLRHAVGAAAGAVALVVLIAAGSYASSWFGTTDRPVAGPGGGSQESPVAADLPAPDGAVRRALEQEMLQDTPRKGLVYDGLKVAVAGPCVGMYELESLPGQCSHGPDAPPPGSGLDVKVPVAALPTAQTVASKAAAAGTGTGTGTAKAATGTAAAQSVLPCYGNGTEGNRVEVLYVYAGVDRSAKYLESIRTWAVGVDTIFVKSAAATGGVRHVRFTTQPTSGGCLPTVTKVRVSASEMNDFDTTNLALQAQGFNRTDRKYLQFVDVRVYCGMGTFTRDALKSASNRNNFGPSYSRVDNGCWDPSSAAHELGHNLGAVAGNAPNATKGGHCVDEWDVMCYSDAPNFPKMVIKCTDRANDDLLDCGKDDYFSTSPRPGSYLALNYNIADNPFLEGGPGGPTPTASPTAPPRPPVPPTPGRRTQYRLQAERSGLCLGVPRAQATRRGAPILQVPCRASDAGQQFLVKGDSLVVRASGMCISVAGGSRRSGASVVQQRCGVAADARRLWSSGKAIGFRHSGQCIDVGSAAARGGSPVVQRSCRGTFAQRLKKI